MKTILDDIRKKIHSEMEFEEILEEMIFMIEHFPFVKPGKGEIKKFSKEMVNAYSEYRTIYRRTIIPDFLKVDLADRLYDYLLRR